MRIFRLKGHNLLISAISIFIFPKYYTLLGLFLLTHIYLLGQEPPLKPTGLFDRSEILLVWDERQNSGSKILEKNFKLKFNFQGFEEGERLSGGEMVVSDTTISFASRQIDVISGDFNNDNMADYLYSYTGGMDSLKLVVAQRGRELNYSYRKTFSFNGKILEGRNLIKGDLNGDGIPEFIIGYRTFDNNLAKLAVFSFNDDLEPVHESNILDFVAENQFVVDLCDFNGDGDDEIIIGFEDSESDNYILRVYDFNSSFQATLKTEHTPVLDYDMSEFKNATITGVDYDNDGKEEFVIAFTKNENDQPNYPDTYIYTGRVMDDPETGAINPLELIKVYTENVSKGRFNYGSNWGILLKHGDLNGDGNQQILLGCRRGVVPINIESENKLENASNLSSSVNGFAKELISPNYFDVADITGDGRDDIAAVSHWFSSSIDGDQAFNISVYSWDGDGLVTKVEDMKSFRKISNGNGGAYQTHYAVSVSDFDGDLFRIGDYTNVGCFSEVVRPLTLLHTPPVHIDYIDGIVHDVNECFGDNDCRSSVQKSTEQYTEEEYSLESTSTGDWGYDTEITVGVEGGIKGLFGISMSGVEVAHYFGGDLEEVVYDKTTTSIGKSTGTSYFQTASMDKRFSRDDALLTIVSDYERWEYPVFNEYDELLGEIVILIPTTTKQENWLRGRQVLEVAGILQLHEPGNLLSYRKFIDSEYELMNMNPDIKEIISIANDHELDLNSNYTETITWGKNFESKNVSVENVVETMPSGGVNILGIQIGAQDESVAKEETITSHVYRAGKNLGIEVFGSSLAANSYEFAVRPYYYWSRNGSLVVDYMIDLSKGSFWQENYSTQDPGFILPNRLDSLKVKNEIDRIDDLDEYYKSPSIMLNPSIPGRGDTVEITCVVHNLSLTSTDQAVEVAFYLGNPEKDGVLISDVGGKSKFTTDGIIEDQHYSIFSFRWVAEFENDDRIYAVIDPDDKMNENKKDNNIAWAPVQRFASCGGSSDLESIPYQSVNFENRFEIYPNPANNEVNIVYSGPVFVSSLIRITDVSGVTHYQSSISTIGQNEEYSIDITHLEPGVYFMTMVSDNYKQVSKLLVK